MGRIQSARGGRKGLSVAFAVGLVGLFALGGCTQATPAPTPVPPTAAPRATTVPTSAPANTAAPGATSAPTIAPTSGPTTTGATTAPTAAPTAAPKPTEAVKATTTPTTTPTAVAQPTATTTITAQAAVTRESANLTFAHPARITVDEHEKVTVQIKVDVLMAGGKGSVPREQSGQVYDWRTPKAGSYEITTHPLDAYSFVHASLQGPDFGITPDASGSWQRLAPEHPAAWTWDLIAKRSGNGILTLVTSGKDDMSDELPWDLTTDFITVSISDKPALNRLLDYLAANPTVIVALLGGSAGLVGLIVRQIKSLTERGDKQKEKERTEDW